MSNLLRTGDLDFADIKANLKAFLAGQPTLLDYDFDGSVISTIVDLLAYNTHYNALYTNMAVNEMFIDSASKRSSIVSIAKLLGYTPRSITTSRATVNLTITPYDSAEYLITLPAGTSFNTEISGSSYTFSTIEDISDVRVAPATSFTISNLVLYEGVFSSIKYIKAVGSTFVIPEVTVDMTSLRVSVYNPGSGVTTIFSSAQSIIDTLPTDNVFFTKHRSDGFYEIYFGDGIFGTPVDIGSTVTLRYLISVGAAANGASSFIYSGGYNSLNEYSVTSVITSAGGAAEEDKESVRFYAPLAYQAQGRAVTANDYAAAVAEAYPDVETISVWGGQDNIPPMYGKVFIAAKPSGRDAFTDAEKRIMKNGIISKKGMVTIIPEFVDPKYFDIEAVCNVYYDPNKTDLAPGAIKTNIQDAIATYGSTLSKFDAAYRHSVVSSTIDSANNSIVSSINSVRIRYLLNPVFSVYANYSVNFNNPFAQTAAGTFWSTRFYLSGYTDRGYLKNNGAVIEFYTETSSGAPVFQKAMGTLDYSGKITLDSMNITTLYDPLLEFVFYPESYDVIPPNGIIVRLQSKYTTVNMIVDTLSQNRNSRSGYIFSSSR